MARLNLGQVFEVAFWLTFGAAAYALSFGFDREIEIYRFGASGWPRAVIALILLAALCQLFQDLREGSSPDADGRAPSPPGGNRSPAGHEPAYLLRMGVTLLLPLGYAALLDHTGFYATTPFFIAAYLFVTGERRLRWLIGVPVVVSVLLVLFFTKLFYVGLPVGYRQPFYDFSNWLLVQLQ